MIAEHRPTAALLNFIYLAAGQGFYKLTSFIALVLLARWLGGIDFGRFAVALAAAQLAEYVMDLGLNQALVHSAAGRPARLRDDLAEIIPLRLLLAAGTVILSMAFVMAAGQGPDLIEIALYMGLAQAASVLTVAARTVFQAFERMEYEALSVSLEGWVRLGGVLYAVAAGYGVLGIAKTYALASFVVLAATVVVILHRFVRPPLRPGWRLGWRLVTNGLPYSVMWLLLFADQRLNVLLLARSWGETNVATLGAAMRLIEPPLVVPLVLAVALFPVAVRHGRDHRDTFEVLLISTQKALLVAALPLSVAFLLSAGPLVELVFGADFADARAPLQVLAVALVVLFVRIGLAQALLGLGLNRDAIQAQAIGVTIDVLLAVALIPPFAEIGAATATLAGSVAATGVSLWALRHRLECRSALQELARPFPPALIGAAVGLVLTPVSVLGGVTIALGVYIAGLRVAHVFSEGDVQYIRTAAPPLAWAIRLAAGTKR